jgi:hypothetical protein
LLGPSLVTSQSSSVYKPRDLYSLATNHSREKKRDEKITTSAVSNYHYQGLFQNKEGRKENSKSKERDRETDDRRQTRHKKRSARKCNDGSKQAIIKKQQQVHYYCNKFKSFSVMAAPLSRNKAPARLSSSPLLWIIALASLTVFFLYKVTLKRLTELFKF